MRRPHSPLRLWMFMVLVLVAAVAVSLRASAVFLWAWGTRQQPSPSIPGLTLRDAGPEEPVQRMSFKVRSMPDDQPWAHFYICRHEDRCFFSVAIGTPGGAFPRCGTPVGNSRPLRPSGRNPLNPGSKLLWGGRTAMDQKTGVRFARPSARSMAALPESDSWIGSRAHAITTSVPRPGTGPSHPAASLLGKPRFPPPARACRRGSHQASAFGAGGATAGIGGYAGQP